MHNPLDAIGLAFNYLLQCSKKNKDKDLVKTFFRKCNKERFTQAS